MRRAFTLIEMIVVSAVIGMLAMLVMPNLQAMKASRDREEAYNSVLRLAQMGRETAIQGGRTYVLTLANGGSTVELNRDEDTQMSRDGANASTTDAPSNVPEVRLPTGVVVGSSQNAPSSSTASSAGTEADGASVQLPATASVGEVVLADKSSSTSDFSLHFYPDGRSEGGGFEMVDGSATRSLSVDRNGLAKLLDGKLPAIAENSWEAGQYEQRASS